MEFILLRIIRVTSLMVMAASLVSCASLSKNECLNANWHSIGYSDGVRGYNVSRQGVHRKSCAEYNVSLDLQRYLQGRDEGLQQYCLPHNGYKAGLRGHAYNNVCPVTLEPDFYQAYRHGNNVYQLQVRFDKKLTRYKKLHHEIHELQDQKDENHQLLGDSKKSKHERRLIKKEISLLEQEINLHERQSVELVRRMNELELEIKHLQSDAPGVQHSH